MTLIKGNDSFMPLNEALMHIVVGEIEIYNIIKVHCAGNENYYTDKHVGVSQEKTNYLIILKSNEFNVKNCICIRMSILTQHNTMPSG